MLGRASHVQSLGLQGAAYEGRIGGLVMEPPRETAGTLQEDCVPCWGLWLPGVMLGTHH